MPYEKGGTRVIYNARACIDWFIKRKQGDQDEITRDEASKRKMVAEMQLAEIEAGIANGELMKVDEHVEILSRKIVDTRNQLLSIAKTMGPLLRAHAGTNWTVLRDGIDEEIRRVLTEMAAA